MVQTAELLAAAERAKSEVIALRRHLHREPEVGLQLPNTQRAVMDALAPLGLEVRKGRTLSSVVARLEGARPGPTVLLRSDLDALPMAETTGLEFASRRDDAAHACGHDAHAAMLVGAARVLVHFRDALAGRVLFMFQPGEEGHDGANRMLAEGLLEPDFAGEVRRAFALHQLPTLPAGTIATRSGPLLGAVDGFRIEVLGRGGHASQPHATLDPIPVACEIVQAIQAFVARRIDAFEPVVVTVAQITAGTARNVIPDAARIEGGFRTVSAETRRAVGDALARIASGVASAHELTATTTLLQSYPATVNDAVAVDDALALARELFGAERAVRLPHPLLFSEDFSHVLARVPGAMAFLGTRLPGVAEADAEPLHSPRMQLDEGALTAGVAMHAAVALSFLGG